MVQDKPDKTILVVFTFAPLIMSQTFFCVMDDFHHHRRDHTNSWMLLSNTG